MITVQHFGKTSLTDLKSGSKDVFLYTLQNDELTAKISTFGACVVSLFAKDRQGKFQDIVLGYNSLADYERQTSYMGCVVGRCCNRIENACFRLSGRIYRLSKNEIKNHLHGGFSGFDKKIWKVETAENNLLKMSYTSGHLEEGYPGRLKASVAYFIKNNRFYIEYTASAAKDTICSLTNHTYFNLNGSGGDSILNHEIRIFSRSFTEDTAEFLPTGRILPVKDTPLDLSGGQAIGEKMRSDYYQLKNARGYNVNYVIKKQKTKAVTHFATAYSPESGIVLKAYTDMPCFEFYTGNYLNEPAGKNNSPQKPYQGFCLEPQFAPNAVNMPQFVSPKLKRGRIFHSITFYDFGTQSLK